MRRIRMPDLRIKSALKRGSGFGSSRGEGGGWDLVPKDPSAFNELLMKERIAQITIILRHGT